MERKFFFPGGIQLLALTDQADNYLMKRAEKFINPNYCEVLVDAPIVEDFTMSISVPSIPGQKDHENANAALAAVGEWASNCKIEGLVGERFACVEVLSSDYKVNATVFEIEVSIGQVIWTGKKKLTIGWPTCRDHWDVEVAVLKSMLPAPAELIAIACDEHGDMMNPLPENYAISDADKETLDHLIRDKITNLQDVPRDSVGFTQWVHDFADGINEISDKAKEARDAARELAK